jgi:hypothetical protein
MRCPVASTSALSLKDHDFDITGAADCPPRKNHAKKLFAHGPKFSP